MKAACLAVLLCLATLRCESAVQRPPTQRKVVCYYTNWSYKRAAPYNLTPDKIDPFLCTHIIYAFADIGSKNNLIAADPEFDLGHHAYANATGLKRSNKNLKVMISVGGWWEGSTVFNGIMSKDTNRREFARNAVRFLRSYQFDGLDLHWQHPTFRKGGLPDIRINYVLLTQALREEFEKEATSTNRPRLLLSTAISHHHKSLPAYDVANLNKYVDFISVISYDYSFSLKNRVLHHSPLYSLENNNNYDAHQNINHTVHLLSEKVAPEKLVLGIPTYGRSYKLYDPKHTALGSHAEGLGDKGPITQERGWLAYFEICKLVQNERWTKVPAAAGPYAYKGDQWVSYDDLAMIRTKVDFVNEKGLGGVMFWTMDFDDFLGSCQEAAFPLIRGARDALLIPMKPQSIEQYDNLPVNVEPISQTLDSHRSQIRIQRRPKPAPQNYPTRVDVPLGPRQPTPGRSPAVTTRLADVQPQALDFSEETVVVPWTDDRDQYRMLEEELNCIPKKPNNHHHHPDEPASHDQSSVYHSHSHPTSTQEPTWMSFSPTPNPTQTQYYGLDETVGGVSRPQFNMSPNYTQTQYYGLDETVGVVSSPQSNMTPNRSQTQSQGSDETGGISNPQSNIVQDLVRIIEEAGGIQHLGELLRESTVRKPNVINRKVVKGGGQMDNGMILESPRFPPILLLMTNSSIYIKEINVYHRR